LADGRRVTERLLQTEDAAAFSVFLEALGEETRKFFGPHPLDKAEARRLCALQPEDGVRRVVACDPQGRIVGYFILELGLREEDASRYAARGQPLAAERCATLAPVVAEDYQNARLAGALFPRICEETRAAGRDRIVLMGGTQERNGRAVRFYQREGFEPHGRFEHPPGVWNIDMSRAV
jgi:GNAT superfamily N-acetyltransferase